ncbi:MAG: type IV pili methyl-accepting chemotaxis transducer N-terminal domain-containing protein [Burkholderiales bacterium]
MVTRKHWTLGSKLALVATPFVILALVSIAITLWVSWRLDGGAAAVNEAGRMRMQANRWALAVSMRDTARLPGLAAEFDRSLELLREGDADRPLAVPWDDVASRRFATVEANWKRFREHWSAASKPPPAALPEETAAFTADIDALVAAIERHMARWTALLHLLQIAMMAFAVLGAAVLLITGYLFVLEPVRRLKQATTRIGDGDFSARVEGVTTDEFGSLADCFNSMAAHLQSLYRDLEGRVAEKTSELDEKRGRLEALYDVTALAANATTLPELAGGFAQRLARVAHADGVALRWVDEGSEQFVLLASAGLPDAMVEAEQCVHLGQCFCGSREPGSAARVIAVADVRSATTRHCANAGFATIVSLPVRLHDRLMGEVNLYYHANVAPTPAERSLQEALTAHLASAMENLRLTALEKESAVAQERAFIARELHDSIAQALAFLKIQVHLMRDAVDGGDVERAQKVLGEIDAGVRECYGDVRELLVHFRTRPQGADIEPALRTTLRKFEHQSGLAAHLTVRGHGLPLEPDLQIQVLHIVQEALSNVRKHAHAEGVWLTVEREPQWRFEVRDDGVGFANLTQTDENRVGLRIMAERAEKIGATLDVGTAPGEGTSIVLTLPKAAGVETANEASAVAASEC